MLSTVCGKKAGKTRIGIKRVGQMPMLVDLQLTFSATAVPNCNYIPLDLMYGCRSRENTIRRKLVPGLEVDS